MPRAVCYRCKRGRPAKGRGRCVGCVAEAALREATRVARCRRLGLCVGCGGERESTRYVNCSACRERHRAAVARWAARPGNAEKNRAKSRRHYYQAKALRQARRAEREGSHEPT